MFFFHFYPEASCKDYRAWYGLGQTYEILKMPYYSLYYYNEAYKLRYVAIFDACLMHKVLPVFILIKKEWQIDWINEWMNILTN